MPSLVRRREIMTTQLSHLHGQQRRAREGGLTESVAAAVADMCGRREILKPVAVVQVLLGVLLNTCLSCLLSLACGSSQLRGRPGQGVDHGLGRRRRRRWRRRPNSRRSFDRRRSGAPRCGRGFDHKSGAVVFGGGGRGPRRRSFDRRRGGAPRCGTGADHDVPGSRELGLGSCRQTNWRTEV